MARKLSATDDQVFTDLLTLEKARIILKDPIRMAHVRALEASRHEGYLEDLKKIAKRREANKRNDSGKAGHAAQ